MKKSPSVLLVGDFQSSSARYGQVGPELAVRLQACGWSVLKTSERQGRFTRLTDMLKTVWTKREQYDLAQVDVYSGPAFLWAEAVCWMLRRANRPYFLMLRGGALPSHFAENKRRGEALLRSARKVIAPSAYLSHRLRDYRSDIEVIPNPVTLSDYEYRPRYGPKAHLIWLRAFRYPYNAPMAVHVLAAVRKRFPDARLTMVGPDRNDGSYRRTRAAVEQYQLDGAVEIIPGVQKHQVPHVLQKGEIFINTTDVDNTPISVLEAMACGLPVVSTNVGGLPYLLDNGRDSLLVPPNDASAMAEAVIQLLTNPHLAEHLVTNARRKVQTLDWDAIFPQWEGLLRAAGNKILVPDDIPPASHNIPQ